LTATAGDRINARNKSKATSRLILHAGNPGIALVWFDKKSDE
jgi:hypothetical protein